MLPSSFTKALFFRLHLEIFHTLGSIDGFGTSTSDEAALAKSKRMQPQVSQKLKILTDRSFHIVLLRREVIHVETLLYLQSFTGRFQRPSGRTLFSDEEGFTFSEAPFEGTLHEDLKGVSPSKGFKRASPSEGRA